MKITALVENQSHGEWKAAHGLSLYIETPKHCILFDVGPDDTLFLNAKRAGIDLSKVDTVILSHGHMDHGGALEAFLKINATAKVYAQRRAFERHYSKIWWFKASIGVSPDLQAHPQVVLLDGDHRIDEELMLFTVPATDSFHSSANDNLYTEAGKDDFSHEQNLMIFGDVNALIMGCGHAGAVNILERAEPYKPQLCVGGYHLWNPVTRRTVSRGLLETMAAEMEKHDIHYYTCHCTGQSAYDFFAERLPHMRYLACGDTIER